MTICRPFHPLIGPAGLGASTTAQMINLTLHEELLAGSRASSHCRTIPQLLQAKAQQPASLAMTSSLASSLPSTPSLSDCLLVYLFQPSCVAPHACLSLVNRWRFGNVGLADARADVLSCRASAPFYVATVRHAYSGHGNSNPLNNTTFHHMCPLAALHLSEQMTKTPYYCNSRGFFHPVTLALLGQGLAMPDGIPRTGS